MTTFQDSQKMIDFALYDSRFHQVHHQLPRYLDTYSKMEHYSSFTFNYSFCKMTNQTKIYQKQNYCCKHWIFLKLRISYFNLYLFRLILSYYTNCHYHLNFIFDPSALSHQFANFASLLTFRECFVNPCAE